MMNEHSTKGVTTSFGKAVKPWEHETQLRRHEI